MTTAQLLKLIGERAERETDPELAERLANLAKFDHLCDIGRRETALWRQGGK